MSDQRLIDANALKFKNLAEVNGRLTYVLTSEEINNAPTVVPTFGLFKELLCTDCEKRPQGVWVDTGFENEYWAEEFECSLCHTKDHWHNFCPNCGARMTKGDQG